MARFQPVNVNKEQTVNITNFYKDQNIEDSPINHLRIGLGWDVLKSYSEDADLDSFVLQLDENNEKIDLVCFWNLKSNDGAIIHHGDNLTGIGDGDDEVIDIYLNKLNPKTKKLIIGINIYSHNVSFNEVENAFVRIVNIDNEEELLRYNLSEEFGKNYTLYVCDIMKNENGTWDFIPKGIPSLHENIKSFVKDHSTVVKKSFLSKLFG